MQDLRDELVELRQTKVRLEEEVRILREALEHGGQVPPMASSMHQQVSLCKLRTVFGVEIFL